MKTSLAVLAASLSFVLLACGGNTVNTNGTTAGNGAGTTGDNSSTTTTTTTTTSGGTTGSASTGGGAGSTTGAALDCWSSYPVANNQGFGPANGQTWPEEPLLGGNSLNFSKTPVVDSTTLDTTNPATFQTLHALNAQGFRYMLIDISSIWCTFCKQEANELPSQRVPGWLPKGGIVYSIIVQGTVEGGPSATPSELVSDWLNVYHTNYPVTLDTEQSMVTLTSLVAWPANMIIRLADMQVMDSFYGGSEDFFNEFGTYLDSAACQSSYDCLNGTKCSVEACGGTPGVCQ